MVEDIVSKGLKPPYDWDEYAACFFPQAENLISRAQDAAREGNEEKASELYLCVAFPFSAPEATEFVEVGDQGTGWTGGR